MALQLQQLQDKNLQKDEIAGLDIDFNRFDIHPSILVIERSMASERCDGNMLNSGIDEVNQDTITISGCVVDLQFAHP